MLENILRWYQASMIGDIRSPLVHLFGPPGCGKSSSVEEAAKLLGVNLHIINVSRLSPLDLEGVQMPVEGNTRLHMLTATWWTQLQDGDIVLLDEFLRGFPEVYNGLLDILTSRRVGGFTLPRVFFIAASNTTVSYDKALEDRLLHVTVVDPRRSVPAATDLQRRLIEAAGLHPSLLHNSETTAVINEEVFPMYSVLDDLKAHRSVAATAKKGSSLRNLIGQVQLREIISSHLQELIDYNNVIARRNSEYQYLIVTDRTAAMFSKEVTASAQLLEKGTLNEIQVRNIRINQAMCELHAAFNDVIEEEEEI